MSRTWPWLLAALVLLLPTAVLITIFLRPFWMYFEATYEIEALGHSGPAPWCYAAVYTVLALLAVAGWIARHAETDA